MAIQSFQIDPAAGGVSQAEFDAHTHSYRKVTQLGVDERDQYNSPSRVTIVDDTESFAATAQDLEAVGITVATEATSTPT